MRKRRIMSFLLAVCILLTSAAVPVQAANPGGVTYLNTHINTGNQRTDILAVALTQMGYKERYDNDTKYGDWYGLPGQPWCAMFISWCARQADISTDILQRSAWASPNSFEIPYYSGKNYTPKPGDLFFTSGFEHVGLVWYVDGEFFYSVEGNAKYHDYKVPDDPEVDSYYVMSNKRRTKDYYFGVPNYKGGDQDHDYVKGQDSAHPHKTYYRCRTCGDQYYTGYTECVAGCSKCFTCGCSSSYAGYYLVANTSSPIRMRSSHSTSSSYSGYATAGEAVYVLGSNPDSGWAYIEYDGKRGHILLKYLTKYYGVPAAPTVTSSKTDYIRNDNVKVTWNAPANTEQYRLKVFKDGVLYTEQIMDLTRTYTLKSLPKGDYEVQVFACNRSGISKPGVLKFTVRDTYTLSYDARGGSGAPKAQTQAIGQEITISDVIPVRDGYTFLGWTDDAKGNFALYNPGERLSAYDDLTLYAVWKRNDAALQTMTIEQMPQRTYFLLGESLDTTGLKLRLIYSDGTGHVVTNGYSTSELDAGTYGTKIITVTYDTLTVTYEVQVVPYIPGDIDLNKVVNRDDVMGLLWHISFPEQFPIETPADFNSDGVVNRDDVMQLLWHISFPDQFTLDIEWPEEAPSEEPDPGDEGGADNGDAGSEDGGDDSSDPIPGENGEQSAAEGE